MIYQSVASHPMLSGTAKASAVEDEDGFAAQQLLAERLLGFAVPALTDAGDLETIGLALAMQLNWQYALGMDPFIYKAITSSKLAQGKTYRDNLSLIDPRALTLADAVLTPTVAAMGDRWSTLRSLRGPQT